MVTERQPAQEVESVGGYVLPGSIRIWHKLFAITCLLAIPTLIGVGFLAADRLHDVRFAERERQGVVYLGAVKRVIDAVPDYWSEAAGPRVPGRASDSLARKEAAAEQAIAELAAVDARLGGTFGTHLLADRLGRTWAALASAGGAGQRPVDLLRRLGAQADELTGQICNASGLILDPEPASFHLVSALGLRLTPAFSDISVLSVSGEALLAGGKPDGRRFREISHAGALLRTRLAVMNSQSLRFVFQAEPALRRPLERPLLEALARATDLGDRIDDTILNADATGKLTLDGAAYRAQLRSAGEALSSLYDQMLPQIDLLVEARVHRLHWNLAVAAGSTMGILLVAMGLVGLVSRSISRDIASIVRTLEGIAGGDLDQAIAVRSRDELADMARSCGEMLHSLRAIVQRVREAATTVAASARQVSADAATLARTARAQSEATGITSSAIEQMAANGKQVAESARSLAQGVEEASGSIEELATSIRQVASNTENLASAVHETSASIEEMLASVQQVARNAQQAKNAAERAREVALDGRAAVGQTVAGMAHIEGVMRTLGGVIGRLGESSAEIGDIVEVIDDIAEQTNLLALNAAIEAARAGEHGRGFAVVADEVRKLAERATKATKEIADLVKGIQGEVREAVASTGVGNQAIAEGTRLAQGAGGALEEIVSAVSGATTEMDMIAVATAEQSTATSLISRVAGRMNQLTQEVALATREQAAGSEQIIRAVERMNQMTLQVSTATREQQAAGEQVVGAVVRMAKSVEESEAATTLIAGAAIELEAQAHQLQDAVGFFRDGEGIEGQTLVSVLPERVVRSLGSAERRLITPGDDSRG